MFYRVFLLSTMLFFACNSATQVNSTKKDISIPLSATQKIIFLDSTTAAQAISEDKSERFFDEIRHLDMEIQMNNPTKLNRASLLPLYKKHLQKSALTFTKKEQEDITAQFQKAFVLCKKIHPSIFPKTIKLIKTDGNHYGPSVYYTRDNCIIIPENVLGNASGIQFFETMLHEIFHIYSRENPKKRNALYARIGFKPLGKPLTIPAELNRRILLNPDGIDFRYKIDLTDKSGRQFSALPIIYSSVPNYNANQTSFFGYLKFELFEIEEQDGGWIVKTTGNNSSTIKMEETDFFRQIGPNTDYIIHPDEVLADNFILLAVSKEDNSVFADKDKQLVEDMERIMLED